MDKVSVISVSLKKKTRKRKMRQRKEKYEKADDDPTSKTNLGRI
jgi:hypothetical protein